MAATKPKVSTISKEEFRQRMTKAPVTFKIVDAAPEGLEFGRKARPSPYRDALIQLREASTGGANPAAEFAETRCEQQVKQAAKKLGIRVLVAIAGDKLYVKLDKENSAAAAVRKILGIGPASLQTIASALAAQGFSDAVPAAIMGELSNAGHAALQNGTNGRKEWALTPGGREALSVVGAVAVA